MQCDRARDDLSAFLDGELAEPQARELGAHLQQCPACAELLADYRRFSRHLRIAGREPVPDAMPARVHATLIEAEASHMPADVVAAWPAQVLRPSRSAVQSWMRQAASLAAVCLLSSLGTWLVLTERAGQTALERDVLAAHVRAMLQDSPVQVASSDQHTVRPWFNGRLEFSPDVKDLVAEGFPLAGGRLDYIDGRRVAALVYRRRLHAINVFMWPSPGGADSAPVLTVRNGYNLLRWTRGGVAYWATSDLNAGELRELQALL